jgi:stage III sporulation protein AG
VGQSNKKFKFIEKIKENKKLQTTIVIILIILVVFVFLTGIFNTEQKQTKNTEKAVVDLYVESLENRLSNTLSQVEGAGKVSVVITVESGMETVLAKKIVTKETASGKEIEETPLLVNGKTVVLKELYPKVIGVLIVAQGANNISVLTKIKQATKSLLDIELNQIEILTMK